MKKLLLLSIFLLSTPAFSQGLDSNQKAFELANSILNEFVEARFKSGLDLAKPHWPLPQVELDSLLNQILTQWPIVEQRFGNPVGKEFVKEERIGDSFIRFYFLHKFQFHSIYWRISFYKPEQRWLINGITFLDDLEPLYELVE